MDQLEEILTARNVEFEIIHHEQEIRTAEEGADLLGIEIGQTAPALVVKSEDRYFALIISGDHGRIDLERVAEVLGCTRLQLAKPKEVQQITGYTVGSVSLILPLPCIVDRGLFRYPYIYGGTGVPASTLKLDPHDLEKVNHVIAFLDDNAMDAVQLP